MAETTEATERMRKITTPSRVKIVSIQEWMREERELTCWINNVVSVHRQSDDPRQVQATR